jgi:hypothetical protein
MRTDKKGKSIQDRVALEGRRSMCDVLEVYRDGDRLVCGYCYGIADSAARSCDQQNCGFHLPEPVEDYRGPIKKCQTPGCGRDFETALMSAAKFAATVPNDGLVEVAVTTRVKPELKRAIEKGLPATIGFHSVKDASKPMDIEIPEEYMEAIFMNMRARGIDTHVQKCAGLTLVCLRTG